MALTKDHFVVVKIVAFRMAVALILVNQRLLDPYVYAHQGMKPETIQTTRNVKISMNAQQRERVNSYAAIRAVATTVRVPPAIIRREEKCVRLGQEVMLK